MKVELQDVEVQNINQKSAQAEDHLSLWNDLWPGRIFDSCLEPRHLGAKLSEADEHCHCGSKVCKSVAKVQI